ncbi:MAG: hypothetical protein PHR65_11500 [Syntrophomonadaceae bacterium]|nr:hypothetical protein [Syntrophomonadaceae bacterium]
MAGKLRNDLTGQQFSYLTVLYRSDDCGNGKKPTVKWACQCQCGNISIVSTSSLVSGTTKSCGCKKRKHGYSHKERLYETWKNMRRRCFDPKNKRWAHYGGRGITICSEWNDYLPFRGWAMANGYADNLTIDRIDVDGNYCPENCRWVDAKTQANNVSRNRIVDVKGQKMTMAELADSLGMSYSAVQHRIERGWDINKIISTPQRRATV